MKKIMIATVAVSALAGITLGAEEVAANGGRGATALPTEESGVDEGLWNNWRLTVGGFGRGNMRAKVRGLGSERVTAFGADLDLQYNVWQNKNFNIWAGIGGTFCPRQKMSDNYGGTSSRSEHQVSDDTYTTYDFSYSEKDRADVDLGYGEFRLMTVPEWKITDALAVGVRVGVAFDWINAKASCDSEWAWNSQFDINIPGLPREIDTDSDSGRSSGSDSQTEFAAQAILGLQATYMFTDWIGLYANFDWRLGGETDFDRSANEKLTVDMSGWYWGAGVVVSF